MNQEISKGRTVYLARPGLRTLRERGAQPMSLRALSQLTGISAAHLARIELGERHASPAVAITISQALNANRDSLFDPILTN